MNASVSAEVNIPLSKVKVILLFLGAALFVIASVVMWSTADKQTHYHPLYIKAVAIVGVLFFGLCSMYGLLKIFDTRPGLIIDERGIVDNSSAAAVGRILWADVVGLKVSEIAGKPFITILVNDPQKFVACGNLFRRMLNSANMKLTGSPINIVPSALNATLEELTAGLARGFERYSRASEDGETDLPGRTKM